MNLPLKLRTSLKKFELSKLKNKENFMKKPRRKRKERKMLFRNLTHPKLYQDYHNNNLLKYLRED